MSLLQLDSEYYDISFANIVILETIEYPLKNSNYTKPFIMQELKRDENYYYTDDSVYKNNVKYCQPYDIETGYIFNNSWYMKDYAGSWYQGCCGKRHEDHDYKKCPQCDQWFGSHYFVNITLKQALHMKWRCNYCLHKSS